VTARRVRLHIAPRDISIAWNKIADRILLMKASPIRLFEPSWRVTRSLARWRKYLHEGYSSQLGMIQQRISFADKSIWTGPDIF
jgi:hypothetical protein